MRGKKAAFHVLMNRDGLSRDEAINYLRIVEEDLYEAIENGGDPEEVLLDQLGLEPDYLEGWIY